MSKPKPWTILVIVAGLLGFFFAAFSTYDFVAHLDRQVHGIHCSFIPGLDDTDVSGSTGCHVTLMSPYSSVFRTSMWGGLPVSLPAMGVFGFLVFFAAGLAILGKQRDPRATLFLMLGTLLPVLTSIVMGYLSIVTLDAACKLCIGIYVSSLLSFVGALMLWLSARKDDAVDTESLPVSWGRLGIAFALGVAFVLIPTGVYAASSPDFERYIGECGELGEMPSQGMLVPVGPQAEDLTVVEVFDPLCPACRGFEQRFEAQSESASVSRQVLLFPLDDECNWMVDDAIHAGACAVSEAILCADEDGSDVEPEEVIEWAFSVQEEIREASEADPEAAAQRASQRFPSLARCIGSPQARARLNLGLRYAVDNQMPIVTPQVFVNGVRMCDEDTDLGMDFAFTHLIAKAQQDGFRELAPPREGIAAPPPRPTKRRVIQLAPRTETTMEPEPESDPVIDQLAEQAEAVSETAMEPAVPESEPEADVEQPAEPTMENVENPSGMVPPGQATMVEEASE